MHKKFLILSIVLLAAAVLAVTDVADAQTRGSTLQPANQPEIFDFAGQVNDPDSPGNANPDETEESVFQQPPGDPEEITNEDVLPSQESAVAVVKNSFLTIILALIVLLSAVVGAIYWYKSRKTK
jgi:hypothetical protein